MCAAPAFAQSHGSHPPVAAGHIFVTPVLCDQEGEAVAEGAFFTWVHIPHSHFTGLHLGFTSPDGDEDEFAGSRIDGGTAGVPFAPAKNWSQTVQVNSGGFEPGDEEFIATLVNVPGNGPVLDFGFTTVTVDSVNQIVNWTWNAANRGFPAGTQFIGIYYSQAEDNDEGASTTSTLIDASVNTGGVPSPNLHTGPRSLNGFVQDCNGVF